jgi:hypothetical protein
MLVEMRIPAKRSTTRESELFEFHVWKPQVSGILYRASFLSGHRARFFSPIDSSLWSLWQKPLLQLLRRNSGRVSF